MIFIRKLIVFAAISIGSLSTASAQEADVARLADGCTSCHGLVGEGGSAIPPIAGKAREDFIAQMTAFRDQSAPATIMNRLARGYSDAEIAALADYFSALEAK
jgi:sulfide dehydrogenase cytochrome subunit